ncbi:polysaccharide deacetylase family protein [Halomarina halobia]|uniref:polysaccharide deacetylase family protein n=1 Tax=Halomarina halobia TaxID=3033386 RepID=UPI0023E75AC9|nr:polysaccharide deacetylase family protein [Halomarina sp. PSR21]
MTSERRFTTRRAFLATGALALGAGCTSPFDPGSNRSGPANAPNGTATESEANGTKETETPTPEPGTVTPEYQGRYFPGGRLVDDMGDLSRWSGAGTVTGDGDVYFEDPQSLRYEGRHQVTLAGDFSDDPIDLSDAALSFAAYFDTPQTQPTFALAAHAPDADNRVEFTHPYAANYDLRWQRYDVAPTRTKGSPDLSAVTKLTVNMYAGDDRPIRFWLDDIRAHPKPDRGKVIFRFDDCHRHHYTDYFKALDEYGYPGIEAVVKREIGRPGRLTVPHLHRMQDAGWDLCNHTTAHQNLAELSNGDIRANVEEMTAFFDEIDITKGTNFLVTPFGAHDGRTLDVTAEHFDLACGGSSPLNYTLTNPMRVGGSDVDGDLEGRRNWSTWRPSTARCRSPSFTT